MPLPSYFTDFLSKIRLSPNQRNDLITGHKTLRSRLEQDETLGDIIISTFLQGSYRRSTAVKPQGDKRADVDVIVVTNLDHSTHTPADIITLFTPFCEKHYKGKYNIQGRSIGIELSYVDLDIVITSAPSQADQNMLRSASVTTSEDLSSTSDWRLVQAWVEPSQRTAYGGAYNAMLESVRATVEWKLAPLLIPDQDAQCWVETHPLEQIRWTRDKNKNTNAHFINVVKALKWWRILRLADLKYPKGYPVEHMIGNCCPDGISSVAEGIVHTLESIVSTYSTYRYQEACPSLPDRGVPSHNVWKRVSGDDFVAFYDRVKEAASIARAGLEAKTIQEKVANWQLLFGKEFPDAPDNGGKSNDSNGPSTSGGFSERTGTTTIGGGRFA
ncbi:MAG: nucleotidyltransferase [Hymenobacter sp.]|nr:MAG: nucleotidyltransferase [Hymenobacter sp.]